MVLSATIVEEGKKRGMPTIVHAVSVRDAAAVLRRPVLLAAGVAVGGVCRMRRTGRALTARCCLADVPCFCGTVSKSSAAMFGVKK